jgi:hypothetical protein
MAFESLVADPADKVPFGRELIVDPDFVVRESTGLARDSSRIMAT